MEKSRYNRLYHGSCRLLNASSIINQSGCSPFPFFFVFFKFFNFFNVTGQINDALLFQTWHIYCQSEAILSFVSHE